MTDLEAHLDTSGLEQLPAPPPVVLGRVRVHDAIPEHLIEIVRDVTDRGAIAREHLAANAVQRLGLRRPVGPPPGPSDEPGPDTAVCRRDRHLDRVTVKRTRFEVEKTRYSRACHRPVFYTTESVAGVAGYYGLCY